MALGGPSKTRGESTKSGGSLLHFMSILKYSRPYYKYLVPGMICIVVVAVTYSVNIAAMLPAFHLIAKNQGIPTWVHQSIAEKRLGLNLVFGESNQPIGVVEVKNYKYLSGRVGDHDKLERLNGRKLTAREICREIAYLPNGSSVRLGFMKGKDEPYEVTAQPKDVNWSERAMRYGATWLPQGIEKGDRLRTLELILGVIIIISIVGGICRFFGEYLIALTAARTVVALRRRMYQRVLNLPISHFASYGVGDLVSRFVQDSIDVYRGLNFVFAKSLRDPLKALFAFLVALAIDWRLTLVTVVCAPIAAVLIRRMGKMIRKASKRLLQNYGRMVSVLEGTLIGIRVVKGYTMETYERTRLHNLDKDMLKHQLRIERIDALSSPVIETVGQIVASLAIIYFAQQMFEDRMEFSTFAALGVAMAAIFDPMRKMSSFYNRLQSANAAMDRVFEVINLHEEEARGNVAMQTLPPIAESIEFRNVTYKYPGTDAPAIDQVNLLIRRGDRVAIVGPNGSGKTTLVSLILRFFEPQEGEIAIDGRNMRDYSIASVRRQMSLITQDTVIFADTIANNIAYGDDRLLRRRVLQRRHPERHYHLNGQNERIAAAAKAAYADEFIREKPDGYETLVGEHGTTLSGGQKQRLSIARAILRNAPIFIFDEATSQIDSESEQKIHDAVERFLEGRTALIIAHRFSTILQADRIVVMDRGKIIDSGRHEELIGRCKLYQNLYGTQIIDDSGTRK
ncbi:MAG TPA: ABC transporter ATP-binding protein [Phycisphaerae bacterium]|nr:ABC transporter ATP-binding protein [Phycisphaerae bacterium]